MFLSFPKLLLEASTLDDILFMVKSIAVRGPIAPHFPLFWYYSPVGILLLYELFSDLDMFQHEGFLISRLLVTITSPNREGPGCRNAAQSRAA